MTQTLTIELTQNIIKRFKHTDDIQGSTGWVETSQGTCL